MSETPPDPEIDAILRQTQSMSDDVQLRAWAQLQRYRAEALAGAHDGVDRPDKERLVEEARARLKARLRRVLATPEMHVGAAVQYVVAKTRILTEHADAVSEVRSRAAVVREEMIDREVRIHTMDGFTPRLAEVAARNNLALRLRDLDNELLTELARLQGVARQRLARLLDDLEEDDDEA